MTDIKRYRRERTFLGATVLIALVLFLFTLIKADALRELFDPGEPLRLVLPDEGLYGLTEGAKIEVLGTEAGKIQRIVIEPDQKIHAMARLSASMVPFVRGDSEAIIRKTFGVAGDSYVEITRGTGEPMDWEYAVLTARPDRAPTDSIGEIMEDVRSRVIPILEQTERTMTALADLTERLADPEGDLQGVLADINAVTGRIERGEGTLGSLLSDEGTAKELEALLLSANKAVDQLGPILEELQKTAQQVTSLSRSINAQSKDLPEISASVKSVMASLDVVMADLKKTSPELPKITRDISASTANIPVLLGMTQQTLSELEGLLRQLRNSWLIGGSGAPPPEGGRLPPSEVRP
ncbi:MlaD family protein [Thiosocius teredinicola]|uniref:MlaD family protein n=1 Tax=Thiosocius teredinicola TaxID=1973002 RepID=UPI000990C419